jgi:hypothetical protein
MKKRGKMTGKMILKTSTHRPLPNPKGEQKSNRQPLRLEMPVTPLPSTQIHFLIDKKIAPLGAQKQSNTAAARVMEMKDNVARHRPARCYTGITLRKWRNWQTRQP